ncbi:MAG: endonuclease/exonuclease/phosphatase family protein [Desulfobaccales bacterium]
MGLGTTLSALACCLCLCLSGRAAADSLTLLTLNLMGAAGGSAWGERAAALTDYLATRAKPPDIIFFQEGYGGPWSRLLHGQSDTLAELAGRLSSRGLTYHPVSRFCFWETRPFSHYRIGFLSRFPPLAQREGTVSCNGQDPRGVAAAVLEAPHMGKVAAVSVHLSPRCLGAGRLIQLQQALALLAELAKEYNPRLLILAGDLNTAPRPGNPLLAELAAQGWVDTFAAARPGEPGATFRLPGNPFSRRPGLPVRIDYIFVKGEGQVLDSRVVLDGQSGPFVSDHAGVLTRLRLPAPPSP